MKLLILLLLSSQAFASQYSLSWEPVKDAYWYQICVDTTKPINENCNGKTLYSGIGPVNLELTDYSSVNGTVWVRVKSIGYIFSPTFSMIASEYSPPISIINGLTQPIVQCR